MQSYIRSDSVVSRLIAGETLIIPIRRHGGDLASIYSLNEVGSLIWDLVQQPRSCDEIAQAVESEFSSHSEQVRQDVKGFLEEMCSLGLISLSVTGVAA